MHSTSAVDIVLDNTCTVSLADTSVFAVLYRGGTVFNLDLINPEIKKRKKKYVNSGVLHFMVQ